MLKIGFVGFGNHANRLSNLLQNSLDFYETLIYHPVKMSDDTTNNLFDLCECDVVFITSPNKTHFKYIQLLLEQTNAMIFCEKPPCTSKAELDELRRLGPDDKRRVFFNFNYRFSALYEFVQSTISAGLIGDVMHLHGILSHGLAFKSGYQETWRGKYPINESVVLDTSAIHFIDLCCYLFDGALEIKSSSPSSHKHGFDSFAINLESRHRVSISLYASYAAPYHFSFTVLGTNGLIQANDHSLAVRYPRNTFDIEGFFIAPPTQVTDRYSFEVDYQNSIQSSLNYFIARTESGDGFSCVDFDLSLATTQIVIDAQPGCDHSAG